METLLLFRVAHIACLLTGQAAELSELAAIGCGGVVASDDANVSKVPLPFRSTVVGGCICSEGLFPTLLVQHGTVAQVADPETLKMSLACASRTSDQGAAKHGSPAAHSTEATGPNRPLIALSIAAVRLHQTGHSCIVQHFHVMKVS